MVIFGKIKFVGESMRLYVSDNHFYEVHHFFNSFVEDGTYAAAGYHMNENKYYLIQIGDKYNDEDA